MSTNLATLSPPGVLELSQNLPNTPGWAQMSQAEKDGIQEITSTVLGGIKAGALAALTSEIGFLRAERFLKDSPMSFTDWAKYNVGPSAKTIFRGVKRVKESLRYASEEDLLYLAQHGLPGMNNLQTGHLLGILPKVPAPRVKTEKARQEWVAKIAETAKKGFQERRKASKPIPLSEDGVVGSLVLSHRHLMKLAGPLKSAERRSLLRKAWGYVMENQAIPGTISVERTPIPADLIPKRGRPRKQRK